MLVALAGGVGAARLLQGIVQVVEESDITVVVNTGDDVVLHGLFISPDLDTVTYTLAGGINPETGWGLRGETWGAMDALERYGGNTWFRLGDRDLGTHLYRTQRLADGARLSAVSDEIARAWGLRLHLLPMTDDRVETRVTVKGVGEVGFQEYFVKLRHQVPITGVRFVGAPSAKPAPGVLEAVAEADALVVCPSNPIVSIGPILQIPGMRTALEARREDTVAVSPIVAGGAIKGPADRMMTELGHEASVVGVARLYAPLAASLVIDESDAALADAVEATGVRAIVTRSVMHTPADARSLAEVTLDAVGARKP